MGEDDAPVAAGDLGRPLRRLRPPEEAAPRGSAANRLRLTPRGRIRHNPPVLLRKPLAIASLLLAIAVLPLLWLGAHAFDHHAHHEHHEHPEAEWTEAAEILVHGHGHAEGTPEHEHHLQKSPLLRQLAPPDLQEPAQVPAVAAPGSPGMERSLRSGARPGEGGIRLSGPAPPLLDLLCVLLI
jgi:hypothetical protein